jgi:hypothetical protein
MVGNIMSFPVVNSLKSIPCVLILALTLSACGMGAQDLSTATPTLSEPELLLKDNFDDDLSGWLEAADAESSQGYRNGQFFFALQAPDLIVWDNAGGNWGDFVLEVEARQVSGDPKNSYGVLFRYIDDGNFYRFDLAGDGYYAVSKLEREEWGTLVDWQASAHVKPQDEANHIKIVCRGPEMRFYANGQELTSVEDSSFERGDVGLFASTFTDPSVEVEFDNLEIWENE